MHLHKITVVRIWKCKAYPYTPFPAILTAVIIALRRFIERRKRLIKCPKMPENARFFGILHYRDMDSLRRDNGELLINLTRNFIRFLNGNFVRMPVRVLAGIARVRSWGITGIANWIARRIVRFFLGVKIGIAIVLRFLIFLVLGISLKIFHISCLCCLIEQRVLHWN